MAYGRRGSQTVRLRTAGIGVVDRVQYNRGRNQANDSNIQYREQHHHLSAGSETLADRRNGGEGQTRDRRTGLQSPATTVGSPAVGRLRPPPPTCGPRPAVARAPAMKEDLWSRVWAGSQTLAER
jgi:hypothetical protein